MLQKLLIGGGLVAVIIFFYVTWPSPASVIEVVPPSYTAEEPGFDPEPPPSSGTPYTLGKNNRYTLAELRSWSRPEGPRRVGVQIGHLDNQSVPTELAGLVGNTGAVFGSLIEEEVNQVIGEAVASLLEAEGVVVDILPATVPPGYVADVFISIHADGNTNSSVRGFKIAGPRRDYSGKSGRLVSVLESAYAEMIPIPKDNNVTRRMTAYYAFNWPRYEHAIHPFTPAAIVETGFLTNAADRAVIVEQPELVAQAIAEGVLAFIAEMPLPMDPPVSLLEPEQPIVGTIVCAPIRSERRGRDNPDECIPSVVSGSAAHFILDGVASSSVTLGQTVSVTGVFRPVQVVDNYFWFPYEVAGFLEQPQIDY